MQIIALKYTARTKVQTFTNLVFEFLTITFLQAYNYRQNTGKNLQSLLASFFKMYDVIEGALTIDSKKIRLEHATKKSFLSLLQYNCWL